MKNKSLVNHIFFFIVLIAVQGFIGSVIPRVAWAGSSNVDLTLKSDGGSMKAGEKKTFDLVATFTGGSAAETLDYFRADVSFPKDYVQVVNDPTGIQLPEGNKFKRVLRLDTPAVSNESGHIVIEIGALTPNGGPDTTGSLTVAKVTLQSTAEIPADQVLKVTNTQVVNNSSMAIPPTVHDALLTGGADNNGPLGGINRFFASILQAIKGALGLH
jgi:hypothetical protein